MFIIKVPHSFRHTTQNFQNFENPFPNNLQKMVSFTTTSAQLGAQHYVAPYALVGNPTQPLPYIGLQYGPPPAAVPTIVQLPSLCLPRVYFGFDEAYIRNVFYNMFGHTTVDGQSPVQRIDLVPREDRKTGEPFNVVFVHFKKTTINNQFIQNFTHQLNQGQELRIYYSHPWFWKVSKRKVRKSDSPVSKDNQHNLASTPKQILAYQRQRALSSIQEGEEGEYYYEDDFDEAEYEMMRIEERMANDPLGLP